MTGIGLPIVIRRNLHAMLLLLMAASGAFAASSGEQLDFANGLFHRGFYKEALDEYKAWLAASPESDDAFTVWLRMGRCALALDNRDEAVHAFDQAAQMAENAAERAEAQASAGEALFFKGDYAAASQRLEKSLADSPAGELRARTLFYLGRAKMERGELLDAASALNSLIKEFPESPLTAFAQYHLAFVHVKLGSAEEAAKAFSAVAGASGADESLRMESRFRAAELYDSLGWTDTALGAYEMLRRDFPGSSYALRADYGYAWALYHSGRYEEALQGASAFLKEHKDSDQAAGMYYLEGNCLQQLHRYEEALKSYQQLGRDYPGTSF
ncbi:MAG TPA: tetratricopeptide repeat protein, partial [Candidatus Hydrogenedentes bacterium]|nr:tetratricopeptide repeat protein [Candidatus Hydrogenedentota bacterium]